MTKEILPKVLDLILHSQPIHSDIPFQTKWHSKGKCCITIFIMSYLVWGPFVSSAVLTTTINLTMWWWADIPLCQLPLTGADALYWSIWFWLIINLRSCQSRRRGVRDPCRDTRWQSSTEGSMWRSVGRVFGFVSGEYCTTDSIYRLHKFISHTATTVSCPHSRKKVLIAVILMKTNSQSIKTVIREPWVVCQVIVANYSQISVVSLRKFKVYEPLIKHHFYVGVTHACMRFFYTFFWWLVGEAVLGCFGLIGGWIWVKV